MKNLSIIISMLIFTGDLTAQSLSWQGCPDLNPSDFSLDILSTGAEILELSPAQDGRIFFVERRGAVKKFDPQTSQTSLIHQIDVNLANSESGAPGHATSAPHRGLVGIVLDPNFDNNGWIFMTYHSKERDQITGHPWYRISRFTFGNDTILPISEKIIIQWPYNLGGEHTSGSLTFDDKGNLFIAVGSNSSSHGGLSIYEDREHWNSLRTSANTNSLMGKILRITPISFSDSETPAPGPGNTYQIPTGNLKEIITESMHLTPSQSDSVLPEIYSMGHRQPYSIQYDIKTGWLTSAKVSPGSRGYSFTETSTQKQGPVGQDEYNLIKKPGNFGYPMFEGNNLAHNFYDHVNGVPGTMFEKTNPLNTSVFNTGLTLLPPPMPSYVAYSKGTDIDQVPGFTKTAGGHVPITGPIYNYDRNNTSSGKLPPHLDRKWIVTDFFKGWVRALEFDAQEESVIQSYDLIVPAGLTGIIDVKLGTDDNLYFGLYSPAQIVKMTYTGDCQLTPVKSFNSQFQNFKSGDNIVIRDVKGTKIYSGTWHKEISDSNPIFKSGVYLIHHQDKGISFKWIVP